MNDNVPAKRGLQPITMQDMTILFRNFSGKEGMYNREGDRSFHVLLDPDTAQRMLADGWNVKQLKSREEGVPGDYHLQVSVSYKNKPPRIIMITSRGRTDIGEDLVSLIDWVDIKNVDLIINPYEWFVNGKGGVKAYLKTLVVIIHEDYLELKYADVPEISAKEAFHNDEEIVDGEIVDEDELLGLPRGSE